MKPTPIIDMFSGTGELARAVADGLNEFTGFQSFSDNYGPARKYLKARFRNVEIPSDFRDQDVPEGSIVAIGAPCQDLSVAARRCFEPRRIKVVRKVAPRHMVPSPPHRPRQGPVAQVEAAVPTFRPGSMKATAPLHSTPPFGRTLQASPSLDSRTMKAD